MLPVNGVAASSSAPITLSYPTNVTLIGQSHAITSALEAYLCDAGVSSTRLDRAELEPLLLLDTPAVIVFCDGFVLSDLLPTLKALHSRRPRLGLVFVAGPAERFALWRAFADSTLPPLVLRDSTPAVVIYDAVRIACDSCLTEHLALPFEASISLAALEGPVSEVVRMLTSVGPLHDHAFDRLLPAQLRAASNQFWTPLEVVTQATTWLEELGVRSVVDIGSGVGKFCVAGALASSCSFVGIEQRPQLAAVARNLARLFGLENRVSIIEGRFGEVGTPSADCYYFYNPFEENLFPADEALDVNVELSAERFRRDVRYFRALVAQLPIGAYVLSYNGIGGRIPECLAEVRVQRELPAVLRLLRKVRRHRVLGVGQMVER